MSGLAMWLAGCVDADETLARDRLCVNCRRPVVPLPDLAGMITGWTHDSDYWYGVRCEGRLTGAEPVHSPGRALAEAAFKRAILEMHEDQFGYDLPAGVAEGRDPDERQAGESVTAALGDLLYEMAEIYKDRPGYQEAITDGLYAA